MDQEEESAGIPEWVVTFGDMMSLLLTFFIMLVSMSEIKEEERVQAIVEALRRRFGHENTMTSLTPGPDKPRNSAVAKLATMGRARRADTMRGGDRVRAPVGENPRVLSPPRGGNVTVGGVIYFEEGSAELSKENQKQLDITIAEIEGKPQKIEVRGHTSARPLPEGSPHRSHWDLAYARCYAVTEYLTAAGINRKRIRISVAGQNEPVHIRHDPVLRKRNSRVEVFMLNELTQDLAGTEEENEARYAPPPSSEGK